MWLKLWLVSKAKSKVTALQSWQLFCAGMVGFCTPGHVYIAANSLYVHVTTDTVSADDKPIKTFYPGDKEVSKAHVRIKMC